MKEVCYFCETYDEVLEALRLWGDYFVGEGNTCEDVANRLWDRYTSQDMEESGPITFRIKGHDIAGWDFIRYYRNEGYYEIQPFPEKEIFSSISLEEVLKL